MEKSASGSQFQKNLTPRDDKKQIFLVKLKVASTEGVKDKKQENTLLYRTLECNPSSTVLSLLDTFKERYGYSDSKTCSWGLFLPARPPESPPMTSVKPPVTPSRRSGAFSPRSLANSTSMDRSFSLSSSLHDTRSATASSEGGAGALLGALNEDEESFIPPPVEEGTWLENEATLASYGIQNMMVLEVKNALRSLKISDLENNLSKTIRISATSTVQQLLDIIAVRFAIADLHILQYALYDSDKSAWLKQTDRICDVCTNSQSTLTLRQRFFDSDDLKSNDPYAIHFLYLECRQTVVNGTHNTDLQYALLFAALQMQITFRNYDPLVHVAGFLNVSEFLPRAHREIILIEEDVYKEHRKLKDLKEADAKARYIKTLMTFPTYGLFFVAAKEKTDKSIAFDHDLLIGVNCDALLCLHPQTRKVQSTYPLHSLQELKLDEEVNRLQLPPQKNGPPRRFQCIEYGDAASIAASMAGYTALLKTKKKVDEGEEGSGHYNTRTLHEDVAAMSLAITKH